MKVFRWLLVFVLSSLAFAHQGFNVVLNDVAVDAYTVSVLEDTHLASGQAQMNLMIQVADGREAAPADTTVKLRLEHNGTTVYENGLPYVGSSSSDGRSFYAYYLAQLPLAELGSYNMTLELNGSLGTAETTVNFQPKVAPEFRAAELVPSLLIIGIFLVGAGVLFASSSQPSNKNQPQKGFRHA